MLSKRIDIQGRAMWQPGGRGVSRDVPAPPVRSRPDSKYGIDVVPWSESKQWNVKN